MKKSRSVKMLMPLRVAMMSALIVACSWISFPINPPLTLQLLAVAMSVCIFGHYGMYSVLLYIALGALGLPVFSGGIGGVGHLFGLGGGYIFGFVIYCTVYLLLLKLLGASTWKRLVFGFVALASMYAFALFWYTIIYTNNNFQSIITVFVVMVLPYIIPNVLKIIFAILISRRLCLALGLERNLCANTGATEQTAYLEEDDGKRKNTEN